MAYYKTASPDRYAILKAFARENRQNQTLAEEILWRQLRGNALGRKFLRQHVVGDYIVDFLCREDGLVIEVDGGYHAERQQQENDEVRTHDLQLQGFRVIRFTNEEVLFDTENVINEIEKQLK